MPPLSHEEQRQHETTRPEKLTKVMPPPEQLRTCTLFKKRNAPITPVTFFDANPTSTMFLQLRFGGGIRGWGKVSPNRVEISRAPQG